MPPKVVVAVEAVGSAAAKLVIADPSAMNTMLGPSFTTRSTLPDPGNATPASAVLVAATEIAGDVQTNGRVTAAVGSAIYCETSSKVTPTWNTAVVVVVW